MTCPGCGALTRINTIKQCMSCDYCGGDWLPEPNEDGVCTLGLRTGLVCPACATALEHASLAGTPVTYCCACRGIWISMEDFPALLNALRSARRHFPAPLKPVDPAAFARTLHCPRCHEEFDTHLYGGPGNVVIDSCERCEMVWLDRGELSSIVAAPDYTGSWAAR